MGKNKNRSWACGGKHYLPTGKNCKSAQKQKDEVVASSSTEESVDERDSPSSHVKNQKKVKKNVQKLGVQDSTVKSHGGQSDTAADGGLVDEMRQPAKGYSYRSWQN